MEVYAIAKNVPMSPQKMREVVRQIQGLPALQAQAVLAVVPRKSARFVAKTLKSAIANAEHFQAEWNSAKIQQSANNLQSQITNTRNHKRRNALQRKLEQFESFLESANQLKPESLRVKVAVTGSAMIIKRFMPKARGSAGPILKRRCHIKITLSDE
jgi:large subunit ribosomal protein L22